MIRKTVSALAAALAVWALATPAAANGGGYYRSYKDTTPGYVPQAGYESRVTVYQAPPLTYPAPPPVVVYEQPVYGYTYGYPAYGYATPDCGCRGYRRRHRRCY